MKKLLLMLLMPLTMVSAQAQSNDYNMVIKLNNGTKITLDANDVKDLTFNGDELSISGNTIADLYSQMARLEGLVKRVQDKASPEWTFTVKGVSFKMVKVAGGAFQMGATSEQGSDAYDSEKPVHNVTLSDYYIGETEVTQALWTAVMGPWETPTSDGDQWSSSYGLVVKYYKPSELLGMFTSYLSQQDMNKQVIFLQGIYLKNPKHDTRWSSRYDILRDENTQTEITLQIPYKLCEDLKDGNLVAVEG